MVYVENKRKELKTKYPVIDNRVLNLLPVTGSKILKRNRIGIK